MKITYGSFESRKKIKEETVKYIASLVSLEGVPLEHVYVCKTVYCSYDNTKVVYYANKKTLVISCTISKYLHYYIDEGWKVFE